VDNKSVLLISFYNSKALGVRYLEKSLKQAGIPVNVVILKNFNSRKPQELTETELELLKDVIEKVKPGLVGLSVMTSFYLESVYKVNYILKENFNIPVVWGGAYPTLFPKKCLEHADYVIMGEGERSIVKLTNIVFNNAAHYTECNEDNTDFFTGLENIENLAYRMKGNNENLETANSDANSSENNKIIINELGHLCQELDEYGYPEIDNMNKYLINNDKLTLGDPLTKSLSYELLASRGCPFSCSYCSSINFHRLYKGKGNYIRFRSVKNVIDELIEAKKRIKNLRFIHFWDEIFPEDENWIDEFTSLYKNEVNLPFGIWVHPLKINRSLIEKLVYAGLYKAVMGIQSGSIRIRKEIFHRLETQEDIINASKILSECKVPRVVYDFILRHPFETQEDIMQSFELCTKLHKPFELQLHGLNFLPGTDIVDMAIKSGIANADELEKIMYAPMKQQYTSYWGINDKDIMINFWYSMIYMTQFNFLNNLTSLILRKVKGSDVEAKFPLKLLTNSKKILVLIAKIKDYYLKLRLVTRNS